mgnify:FL=1
MQPIFKAFDKDQMTREFTHWHSLNQCCQEVDCPLCYKELRFKSVLPHLKNNCCSAILRYSPANRYSIIELYSATNPRNRPKVNTHCPTSEEELGGEITNVFGFQFEGNKLLYKVEVRFREVFWMENSLLKKSTEGRKWIQRVNRWRKRGEMKGSIEELEATDVIRADASNLKRTPKPMVQQVEEDIEEFHIQLALDQPVEEEVQIKKKKKKNPHVINWKLVKSKLIKAKYWADLIQEIDSESNNNNSRLLSSTLLSIITFLMKDLKTKSFTKLTDNYPTPAKFFQSLDINKKFFLTLGQRRKTKGKKMASTVCSNISSILKMLKVVKINESNYIRLRQIKAVKKFYLQQRKKARKSANDLKKHAMRMSVMKAEGKLCSEESFKAISEFTKDTMEDIIKSKVNIKDNRMVTKTSKFFKKL